MTEQNAFVDTRAADPIDSKEPTVPEGRSPHGTAEQAPEDTETTVRAAQQQSVPSLPWWLSEKFFWAQGPSGAYYLKPFESYMQYVLDKAPAAALAGRNLCAPGTQEASLITQGLDEVEALRQTFAALSDNEAGAFVRFLADRCLRNAVYAATTQHELVSWTERAVARNEDATEHQNYGEKESRRDSFMRTAGALYILIQDAFPAVDLSQRAFEKKVKQVIYDTARMEGNKLKTPAQLDEDQKAVAAAAKIGAEAF